MISVGLAERALASIPGDKLEGLVQTMLDENVAPIYLAGPANTPVTDEALSPVVQSLHEFLTQVGPDAQETIWTELGRAYELNFGGRGQGGLEYALAAKATSPKFFEIPESLFGRGDPRSRVFERYPELLGRLDRKGLVTLDRQWHVDSQALFYKEHALAYHQFLRRGFTSNINDQLMTSLIRSWRSDPRRSLRLAIDERRLQPRDRFRAWGEKDYWYGPPLNERELDDLDKTGLTRHVAIVPEALKSLFECNQIIVRWTADRSTGLKVCEMEELVEDGRQPTSDLSPLVLLRYFHSIRDTRKRAFVHIDGGVRAYDRERYLSRAADPIGLGATINPDRYRKVWRIDGELNSDEWSEFVALWYRGNELVLEYLDPLAMPGSFGRAAVRHEREAAGIRYLTRTDGDQRS